MGQVPIVPALEKLTKVRPSILRNVESTDHALDMKVEWTNLSIIKLSLNRFGVHKKIHNNRSCVQKYLFVESSSVITRCPQ